MLGYTTGVTGTGVFSFLRLGCDGAEGKEDDKDVCVDCDGPKKSEERPTA